MEFESPYKEIEHWKKAFENENKIAGKLQSKVERLEKEKKMFIDWVNKLQIEKDELKHRIKMLVP